MKLSASSSVIFATLAISSSTSSLAAPTRDNYDTGLSSPTKNSHTARDPMFIGSPYRPGHHKRSKSVVTSTASRVSTREDSVSADAVNVGSVPDTASASASGLLEQLLGPMRGIPIVGPLIAGLVDHAQSVTSLGALSADGIDPSALAISQDDMVALEAGIAELVRAVGSKSDGQVTSTSTLSSSAPVGSSTPTQTSINRNAVAAAALSDSGLNALGVSGVSSSAPSATPSQGASSAEATPSATSVVAAGEGPSLSSSASSAEATPSATSVVVAGEGPSSSPPASSQTPSTGGPGSTPLPLPLPVKAPETPVTGGSVGLKAPVTLPSPSV